jgi:hypothetical protein
MQMQQQQKQLAVLKEVTEMRLRGGGKMRRLWR